MMDILATLAGEHKKQIEESQLNDEDDELRGYHMHPEVFRVALEQFGLDEETLEDCLLEETNKWDYLLEYFTNKKRG
jgi:hypothetical protein